MEKIWFYFEPYTFILCEENNGIIYNSLNKKYFIFQNQGLVRSKIIELKNILNLYCIEVSNQELNNSKFKEFVSKSVEIAAGSIVNSPDDEKKPISLLPRLKLIKDFDHPEKSGMLEKDVRNNLTEISFYLNGGCNVNCKYCDTFFKQIPFCTKSQNELSIDFFDKFISSIGYNNLQKINILGGNLLNYKYIDLVISKLNTWKTKKEYFIHYLNLPISGKSLELLNLNKSGNLINLLITFPLQSIFTDIISFCEKFNLAIKWTITITSEKEYYSAEKLINEFHLTNCDIKPIATGRNTQFFQKHVFLSKSEILSSNISKRQLFSREVINSYDFGKLLISTDGKVFANINHLPIGSINSNINELIYNELKDGISWRKTRLKDKPCSSCMYNLLCPSPSNYEIVLGKSNLCNVR